ncbi:MAG TPA: NADH-quinone oxidoreductase subunit N [candidate division Zixibacteria bacterium]|nr:NADH-quinone oxidoreductase subunit N [candidate division Zixibacteria bacterium]
MAAEDFTALMPLIILAAAALVVLLQSAIKRSHGTALILTCLGLAAAFVSMFYAADELPRQVTALLIIDSYALFFTGLILFAAFAVAIFGYNYLNLYLENREEFYIVLLLASLGSSVLVSSNHFMSFFLGLEILTVSLYVMIGYMRKDHFSLEAGIKYLILAAASSAFLLFGMALLYAETGTMEFNGIANAIGGLVEVKGIYILAGTALFLVGAGFKLAVAPFHMWTPDVYEGAPAPVTAFVATVSKGAMAALLLRYFIAVDGFEYTTILLALSIIAVASMFLGNILALMQKNVKRILAYSSIAHLGYILVAFIAGGERAVEAVSLYLVVYFVTTLGAFGIISLLADQEGEKFMLESYRGMFWRRPWISLAFSGMLLSLAGVPLTAGFIGKFFVLLAGVGTALWTLVIILVITSAIGLYYYIKIIATMFSRVELEAEQKPGALPVAGSTVLAGLTILLLYFGIYPVHLIRLIRDMVLAIS